MTDQDPAVILEHIREGAESEITHPDDECGAAAGGSCTPHGALFAVAALERVLELADDADDAARFYREKPEWARKVREAITTALTGQEHDADHA